MSASKPLDFSSIEGNEPIKRYLTRMVANRAIANSLLFAGPSGVGKSLFAQRLAEMVVVMDGGAIDCERRGHPDIHHYHPEGRAGLHSIHAMRQLSEEVALPPFESTWKVFVIHEAHHMYAYSANALLKTFEEPPPRTLIILLSSSPAALLPTIRSRCRTLYFQSQSAALFTQPSDPFRAPLFEILMHGPMVLYRDFSEQVRKIADEVEAWRVDGEAQAKKEQDIFPAENLTAMQREAFSKELEGMGTLQFMKAAERVFGHILSWYRDLHLLEAKGAVDYLMNPDYLEKMKAVVQSKKSPTQEKVREIIDEALLSLQRSTAFHLCLESALLKLWL